MIYSYNDIRRVHLEISSKCNASCPQCARNKLGGPDNPILPDVDLSLDQIKTILPEDFVRQLTSLYMCGNYGDPIVAPDTLLVCEWLREINPSIKLGMHTNGSARTPEWWQRLGRCFSKEGDYIKFGIDGLKDTNHLYRRGTQWDKLMANVSAFIAAGGNAQWEYIVFKHNEHQVEQAEALSRLLGFSQFRTKKTGRFFIDSTMENKDRQEVWNRNEEVEYYLEAPDNPKYKNTSLQSTDKLIEKYGSMNAYLDGACIRCKVAEDKNLYISAEGLIFPCCWTANQLYIWYQNKKTNEIWKLIDHDKRNVSALELELRDIVEGPYFQKIYNSWSKPDVRSGKLKVCAKTCGTDFDPFATQFTQAVNTP